jgi:hypothetical protein
MSIKLHNSNKGIGRQNALILIATKTTVSLEGEWLEAFWCDRCEQTKWHHVKKSVSGASPREACTYKVSVASPEL